MREHHLTVGRTARYYTLGGGASGAVEPWLVLHGYGQLAGRFLSRFESLATPARLFVAPEGLSRFYVDGVTGPAAQDRKVGASWMTREDRLVEIEDYVGYLDRVHADACGSIEPVNVLAFSQGTATACRWLARGRVRAKRVILWGGEIPPDLDLAQAREHFAALDLVFVLGRQDPLITPKIVARDTERLKEHGLAFRAIEYDGGHEIDDALLTRIVTIS